MVTGGDAVPSGAGGNAVPSGRVTFPTGGESVNRQGVGLPKTGTSLKCCTVALQWRQNITLSQTRAV